MTQQQINAAINETQLVKRTEVAMSIIHDVSGKYLTNAAGYEALLTIERQLELVRGWQEYYRLAQGQE